MLFSLQTLVIFRKSKEHARVTTFVGITIHNVNSALSLYSADVSAMQTISTLKSSVRNAVNRRKLKVILHLFISYYILCRFYNSSMFLDTCNLPIERGPCAGNFARWGFNPEKRRCEQFVWGGCEGNANRFNSEAACLLQCDPPGTPKRLYNMHQVFVRFALLVSVITMISNSIPSSFINFW